MLIDMLFCVFSSLNFLRDSAIFPQPGPRAHQDYPYAKGVKFNKKRKEFTQDLLEELETVLMGSARAQAVIDAS